MWHIALHPSLRSRFRPLMRILAHSALCAVLLETGCARAPLTDRRSALRPAPAVEFTADDLQLAELDAALRNSLRAMSGRPPQTTLQFGPRAISVADYSKALRDLLGLLEQRPEPDRLMAAIKERFEVFEVYGDTKPGSVLVTSYFEPVIGGSTTPLPPFTQPLYRLPPDLITVDLRQFLPELKEQEPRPARLRGGKLLPYFTRAEIDSHGALSGRALEICWVDPIDAFFLQIQGSGSVRLLQGGELTLRYAGKNGQAYRAIGKHIKTQLGLAQITMQQIERHLRSLPPMEAQEIMNLNPSYVFFAPSDERALTALSVPATPGRTIATDRRFFPDGALAYLTLDKAVRAEDGEERRISRFVLDQDSGGAIRGGGRVDLFWGRGEDAKRFAGTVQGRGRLYYLLPRQ